MALRIGSISLFNELEKKEFKYNTFSKKERQSFRMYLNRSCFRPTPFGLFSAFSTLLWYNESKIELSETICPHVEYSYSFLEEQSKNIIQKIPFEKHLFTSNPSLYNIGNEYRYLIFGYNQIKERDYFIDSFAATDLVSSIIQYTEYGRTADEIAHFVCEAYDLSVKEAANFIKELVDSRVLLSNLYQVITDKDYLIKLARFSQTSDTSFAIKILKKKEYELKEITHFIKRIHLRKTSYIHHSSQKLLSTKNALYINVERPTEKGTLSKTIQDKILDGLYCINALNRQYPSSHLMDFAKAFKRKFGTESVPLLLALDPEIGVGYADLSENISSDDLLADIPIGTNTQEVQLLEWDNLQQFFLRKWHSSLLNHKRNGQIVIDPDDLSERPLQDMSLSLPPSMAVIFRMVDEMVYIQSAGGNSALSLSGRLTPFSQPIYKMTREIADIEAVANPDIIFAELVHIDSKNTANINKRRKIRDYEIPFSTRTINHNRYQISLNNLWIKVIGEEVFLWSSELRRRIIPRLSSAYNYNRSNHPVFRFLCDLQNQGLKTDFSFNLSALLPGLDHYPRVQYKSAILQLETWKISNDKWTEVFKQPFIEGKLKCLRKMSRQMTWPRYISINRSDNQIIIDQKSKDDLKLLIRYARKHPVIEIKECPFLSEQSCIVKDKSGKPYIGEFIASIFREKTVYTPIPSFLPPKKSHLVRKEYLLGSEWLFFKLYCHPSRSNELLIQEILPLIREWGANRALKKWFFIRYNDPDYHLRVRLNMHSDNLQKILSCISEKFTPLVDKGIVSDIQFSTYQRELERYPADIMEQVESAFEASSDLVIGHLKGKNKNSIFSTCQFAFISIEKVLESFDLTLSDRDALFSQLYHALSLEFKQSQELNSALRKKVRKIRQDFEAIHWGKQSGSHIIHFRETHATIASHIQNNAESEKRKLISDLIHMHLNRLFTSNQRANEMVLYYCLWKYYQSVRAREKKALSFSAGLQQSGMDQF